MRRASTLTLALSAAALAFPVSIAAGNAALALLTLALLARLRAADDRARAFAAWRAEPALYAVAAYVAAGLLSGALGDGFAQSLGDSLKDAHRLWSLALFVAAFSLEPEARPWGALAAGLALASSVGVAQSLLGWLRAGAPERAHAFMHPVTFGEVTALGALGGLCWLSRERKTGAARATALAATALAAAALALSQTRAALLALGVGAVAAAWLEPRARRWAAAGLGLGTVGAALGEWLRYNDSSFGAGLSASGAASRHIRYVLWDVAWRMFRDHPWTGVGPGHYRTEYPRYFVGILDGNADWGSAHNLYLHQLAERGVVGGVVLAVLLGILLARAWRAARASSGAAALWAAAAVPAFLVMNATETAWQSEQFATLFLLVWAFGTASGSTAPR